FFFFSSRRRHTRSDRDWSSDVCSSDLSQESKGSWELIIEDDGAGFPFNGRQIGRASCRESVDLGGRRIIKKKKKRKKVRQFARREVECEPARRRASSVWCT